MPLMITGIRYEKVSLVGGPQTGSCSVYLESLSERPDINVW